ncbi:MAG: radical SAM protein [Desulfobacterales bacterium]|jgi:MoaA/NifB/PqqE/SkfB family radical SAM enzyme|nr:radical SAM protein [Desulfobacterales bacterium]
MRKTVSFSRHTTNVFFHILTRCNLSCRHCYINPAQHGEQTLSPDIIARWLEVFTASGGKPNLILLGGEPTLHPHLDQVVHAARSLGYGSITIDTNGYLFHGILDKTSPEEVDYFSFSLDGATKDTNDAIRGNGCYEACTAGIREAVHRGYAASLIYTVSRDNIHELTQMPPLLEKLGVNRFFIQVIGLRGQSAGMNSASLQVERGTWKTLIPDVARQVADLGIAATYPKVFLEPDEQFECAGLVADNYFIFPNGRVYRCPLCEDYPIHSLFMDHDKLSPTGKINETDLFSLQIPEGCVMNKLLQPGNLLYKDDGSPEYRIACCMLKEEIS